MSEMEHTADHLVVVGRGRLIAAESLTEFAARGSRLSVTVGTPEPEALAPLLTTAGGAVRLDDAGRLSVTGLPAAVISELALEHRIALHELTTRTASLEEAFMEITAGSVEFPAGEGR
jgi:ABC-2 type transport system ATP-binding protein